MATDTDTDIWTDLLASATSSHAPIPKKHLLILGEPSRGKQTLVRALARSSVVVEDDQPSVSAWRARNRGPGQGQGQAQGQAQGALRMDVLEDARLKASEGLVVGYEWIEISPPGEPDRVPPLSVYIPSSSEPLILQTFPSAIPRAPADTGVLVVLDWSKPQTMLEDLLRWLTWLESWTTANTTADERAAGRQRLKSIIQHYGDAPHDAVMHDIVLPLNPETLVHNASGIPITIVITHTDTIRSVGDRLIARGLVSGKGYSGRAGDESREYLAGMAWEERVEWMMQVIRTVALRYGASVIHTSTADPSTLATLRAHTLHSLYHLAATHRPATSLAHRFPFPHPPNALDRDRLVIPLGWDSPARIRVLRESFDVQRIGAIWDDELKRKRALRDLWTVVVPDSTRETRESRTLITCEPTQSFLARQLEFHRRDPRERAGPSFRPPTTPRPRTAVSAEEDDAPRRPVGVVGPIASGGLAMPSVVQAVARMEDDEPEPTPAAPSTSNELLNNFFQGLIAGRRTPGSTPVKE